MSSCGWGIGGRFIKEQDNREAYILYGIAIQQSLPLVCQDSRLRRAVFGAGEEDGDKDEVGQVGCRHVTKTIADRDMVMLPKEEYRILKELYKTVI